MENLKLSELINILNNMYKEHGDCNVIFESNKHQYGKAKAVYHQEINNNGEKINNIILSCFNKIR